MEDRKAPPEFKSARLQQCEAEKKHRELVKVRDRNDKRDIGFACMYCGAFNTNGERPAEMDFVTP